MAVAADGTPVEETAGVADGSKVIYGADGRRDLYQLKGPNGQILRNLAGSTVALFHAARVKIKGDPKIATLGLAPYGTQRMCKDEPFYDQESGAFCSGSLVAPDIIMTAGHCITSEEDCKNAKFVFGFAVTEKDRLPRTVPVSEVYGCAKLLGRDQVIRGADWALIKLDRRVENHAPLPISRTGEIKNGTKLFVIGHPSGLPTKIAGGASVRNANLVDYFVANLDTYRGNSGSAVFNAVSGKIEGILVEGEQDFEVRPDELCIQSKRCPEDGCRGEDVTKISVVAGMIPMEGTVHASSARLQASVAQVPARFFTGMNSGRMSEAHIAQAADRPARW